MITDTIRAHQPDAVGLLEANSQANVVTLAHDLAMQYVYGEANSAAAVAWLSRLPIAHSKNHRLPVLAKTLLEVGIVWEGMLVSLFATHLIHGRTAADAEHRAAEVRAILKVLDVLQATPHVLVGDFNAIHPNDSVGNPPMGETQGYIARQPIQLLLTAGYTDCYRTLHQDIPGYTYPAPQPWLRLDYIFASAPLVAHLYASNLDMGPQARRASDHLPVWAEFR